MKSPAPPPWYWQAIERVTARVVWLALMLGGMALVLLLFPVLFS